MMVKKRAGAVEMVLCPVHNISDNGTACDTENTTDPVLQSHARKPRVDAARTAWGAICPASVPGWPRRRLTNLQPVPFSPRDRVLPEISISREMKISTTSLADQREIIICGTRFPRRENVNYPATLRVGSRAWGLQSSRFSI
jgi:hypothetical protein